MPRLPPAPYRARRMLRRIFARMAANWRSASASPAGHGTQPTRHRAPPRSRARSATDTASAGSHQQPPPLRAGTAGILDGPAPSTPEPHGAGATSRNGNASPPPQTPVVCASARPSHGSPRRARPPQPPADRPRTLPRRGASDRASAARSTRAARPLPKCHVLSCFRDTV